MVPTVIRADPLKFPNAKVADQLGPSFNRNDAVRYLCSSGEAPRRHRL